MTAHWHDKPYSRWGPICCILAESGQVRPDLTCILAESAHGRPCRAVLLPTKTAVQHLPSAGSGPSGPLNLLWDYSIEYGNTQLSGPIREAGVAELSGPASAPSLSGSRTIRGYRSLGRQCPSAPPAALQSDNFRPFPEMPEMWRQKRR